MPATSLPVYDYLEVPVKRTLINARTFCNSLNRKVICRIAIKLFDLNKGSATFLWVLIFQFNRFKNADCTKRGIEKKYLKFAF